MNTTKIVPVQAKSLGICLKVRDEFAASLLGHDGNLIGEYEGYVPGFMPGNHYGDYVELEIDIDTGQITNWKVPTSDQLEKAFMKKDEDE